MQNRYAGDVGDFLKLGLLRQLTQPPSSGNALRLGIVWYLVPDEGHNADGKHVAYLDPSDAIGNALRKLDPDLHRALQSVVREGRSVTGLERSGAIPAGTVSFAEQLDFGGLPNSAPGQRRNWRVNWLRRALAVTAACELVFVDPDNGLRVPGHASGAHTAKANKHCYLDELAHFAQRGQSVVAYHHADRSAPVTVQIQRRLHDLAAHLPIPPLAAVRASRGSTRLFLIAAAPEHRPALADRLTAIEQSPWASELRVTWWSPNQVEPNEPAPSPPAHSVHVALDQATFRWLEARAASAGTSVAAIARQIIEREAAKNPLRRY